MKALCIRLGDSIRRAWIRSLVCAPAVRIEGSPTLVRTSCPSRSVRTLYRCELTRHGRRPLRRSLGPARFSPWEQSAPKVAIPGMGLSTSRQCGRMLRLHLGDGFVRDFRSRREFAFVRSSPSRTELSLDPGEAVINLADLLSEIRYLLDVRLSQFFGVRRIELALDATEPFFAKQAGLSPPTFTPALALSSRFELPACSPPTSP
jgi:hypothetical protein